jgi:hypothetical protein
MVEEAGRNGVALRVFGGVAVERAEVVGLEDALEDR